MINDIQFQIEIPQNLLDQSKPPRDAYLFFPSYNDIIEFDPNKPQSSLRKIFEGKAVDTYTPFEKQKLKEFETQTTLQLPQNWKKSDTLRFLQACGFDPSKTTLKLKAHFEWKNKYFPLRMTSSALKILNSGYIYVHGRDNHYRPIVVVSAQKYAELSKIYSQEDFILTIIYFTEHVNSNMMIPGQVETWNIIGDATGFSVLKPPKELMNILTIVQNNYRCLVACNYIFNMSTVLQFFWMILKNFMEPGTVKKIKFLTSNNEILEGAHESQVEEKYGGTAKNIESGGYWPPIIPSEIFLKEEDKREEILVDEEKYIKMALKGEKINTISPYLKDRIMELKQRSHSDFKLKWKMVMIPPLTYFAYLNFGIFK